MGDAREGVFSKSFTTSLCAGAIAGLSVDFTIYPLDTLRARLQAPGGFAAAGGFRALYRGVSVALVGSAPGSALFFCTFEAMQVPLGMLLNSNVVLPVQVSTSAIAALGGELVASCVRVPTEMIKQRLQTHTQAAHNGLYVGWRATLMRALPFSTIQYPLYNLVKRFFGDTQQKPLDPWKAALCGSATSAMAAAVTTPLDLAQTRLMLDSTGRGPRTVCGTLRQIYLERGCTGLFAGMLPRTLWMGLGGLIFLGSYEQAKFWLQGGYDHGAAREAGMSMVAGSRLAAAETAATAPPSKAQAEAEGPSGTVALLSGGLAGMAIDGVLHPIDTLKARSIFGPAGLPPLASLSGMRTLWQGLGVALLPAIPASAVFFATYEVSKRNLEQNRLFDLSDGSSPSSTACCCVAAASAEGVSCLVRVPAEALKMRLQARQSSTVLSAFQTLYLRGGMWALYRGLPATIVLDVPFALLQFPAYEAIRGVLARRRLEREGSNGQQATSEGLEGALAGALAGGLAGFLTTPLDVVRTRHVLSPLSTDTVSSSFLETAEAVYKMDGLGGFFRGAVPRTLYTTLGGAVYLGTYSVCAKYLATKLDRGLL
mmetsp:Transcript_71381/g.220420  ORF Transcript_71381/g.220420 Transcript_71381/m.220420 type:complete len:597 (+) Transcript_71381:125-1915(+)